MIETVVSTDRLTKNFQSGNESVKVIRDLSLRVSPGESLAVLGRSGSGKSTLLNMLCGLVLPDAGSVTVSGHSFKASEPAKIADARWAALRKQSLGVVFQEANLMPALTLLDNVRLRASLAGRSDGREQDWLERLGVGPQALRFPDQVSGGQRQRAALAMVFAMTPTVILADEPTGSLDRHTADAVTDCLFEVQQQTGCALILATHDVDLAERCDQRLELGEDR